MHPQVLGVMARQDGLIRRRQALDSGMSEEYVAALLSSKNWVSVRRGVYAEASLWSGLDSYVGRPLLVCRAASLATKKPHVASHDYAALELGLPYLRPARQLVHITRPGVVGSRTRYGVKHHLAPYRPDQVVDVGGRPVLDLARTAVDLAREHGLYAGVVAFDAALAAGASFESLDRAIEAMVSWPYVTVVRAALELARRGAESILESLGRLLLVELGFEDIQTQFGLYSEGREVWCDLRIDRHIVECDGLLKLLSAEEGGVATRPAREVVWEEKKRQDFITGFKLGMSRLVWDDVHGPGREAAKVRIQREYLDTCRRFGTSIDDLTPYVITRPRRRAA